jgi:hypothetical protein
VVAAAAGCAWSVGYFALSEPCPEESMLLRFSPYVGPGRYRVELTGRGFAASCSLGVELMALPDWACSGDQPLGISAHEKGVTAVMVPRRIAPVHVRVTGDGGSWFDAAIPEPPPRSSREPLPWNLCYQSSAYLALTPPAGSAAGGGEHGAR